MKKIIIEKTITIRTSIDRDDFEGDDKEWDEYVEDITNDPTQALADSSYDEDLGVIISSYDELNPITELSKTKITFIKD